MKLVWSEHARRELLAQIRHIYKEDKEAARRINKRIKDMGASLLVFPYKGREGQIKGSRKIFIPPHYLVYKILASRWELFPCFIRLKIFQTEYILIS